MLENALDAVVVTDANGFIIYWNRQAQSIFGWGIEDVRGKSIGDLIVPPEMKDAHERGMKRVMETGVTKLLNKRIEITAVNSTGETFPVELTITKFSGEGGTNFGAFIRDITERKDYESQLRENEELFNIITSGVSDLIVILDVEGKRLYASDSYTKMFGAGVIQMGSNSFAEVHPEDRPIIQKIFADTIAQKQGQRAEYRFLLPDNSIRYIESQGNLIFDKHGDPYRVVVVSRDITAYKTTEEKLQKQQQLLQSINKNISEAIFRITPEGKPIYVNDAFANMFGYNNFQEVLDADRYFIELLPNIDTKELVGKNEVRTSREYLFTPEVGDNFWAMINCNTLINDNGEVSVIDGAISDITQLKRVEDEIRGFNRDLEFGINERTIELKKTNEMLQTQIAVREKAERVQNALYQISESIHNSPDLHSLFKAIHEIVATLMSAKNFYIALYDEKADLLQFPYRVDEKGSFTKARKLGKGMTEYVMRTEAPLLATMSVVRELHGTGEVEQSGPPAPIWLGVPLIIAGKAAGVMAVQDYDNEDMFGENEKLILSYVSDQVARAIEQKTTVEQEKLRIKLVLENRNVLLELAQSEESSFEISLKKILASTAHALKVERVGFWKLIPDRGSLCCEMLYVLSKDLLDDSAPGKELPASFPWRANTYATYVEALKTNRPLVAADAQSCKSCGIADEYLLPHGINSMMDVPVWFRGEIVGIIALEHVGAQRAFSLEEEDFVASISSLVTIAMESETRKGVEEILRSEEEKYRKVVENSNDAIVIVQEGIIRYANKRTTELTGYSFEQITSAPFTSFVFEEDRPILLENYMRRMRGEEVPNSYEFRIVLNSGLARIVELNTVMIQFVGKPATLNFLTDITERKRAEEEIKRNLAKERELSDLRSRFISMASHEFKTPLTTIYSSAEILERYSERLTNEQKLKNLKRIQENVTHMTQLLNDVLLIGKTQAGKLELKRELVDIAEICDSIIDQFESGVLLKTGHKLTVTKILTHKHCFIDPKIMRQILENLISNAIKYSPNESAVIVTIDCNDTGLNLSVQDFGIGIPDDDVARLFEPFHRATNVGTISGTGLGLAITKQSVELHGGEISVETVVGSGTFFKVFLPNKA